ncbi:MAG: isocitrate/isopropylmalate family dehydrogenase, partial [Pseudomonadota bacterium]
IGLLGSASVGSSGPGLFEPIHGSAPDIAGQDKANPAGMLASAAMMLDRLGHGEAAEELRAAVATTLRTLRTADLGGTARCSEFGRAVGDRLAMRIAA